MNNKQIKQTLFAMCAAALLTTGCSNDVLTSGEDYGNKETIVAFRLGLPGGDEVNYTRADDPLQDATEWAIKTLKVYDFKASGNDTVLAGVHTLSLLQANDELTSGSFALSNTASQYNVRISIPGAVGEVHKFAFLANDVSENFDNAMTVGTTTIDAFRKSIADKKLSDGSTPDTFFGTENGLAMTGLTPDMTLALGENKPDSPVQMKRMMARFDVKNFVNENRNFQLVSVELKTAAPHGTLFERASDNTQTAAIWDYASPVNLAQNPKFTESGYKAYSTDNYLDATWVGQTTDNGRPGTWYKKVLYAYEYLATRGATPTTQPTMVVKYTLNGAPNTVEIPMTDGATTKRFDILRNHVYTLQIGDTKEEGQPLTFSIKVADWDYYEINADL